MANPEQVKAQMRSAGYENIAFERVDEKLMMGSTPQEAVDFALAIGPAGEVFREAGELAEAQRAEIEEAMRRYFDSLEKTELGVWAPSSSWIITARNPA